MVNLFPELIVAKYSDRKLILESGIVESENETLFLHIKVRKYRGLIQRLLENDIVGLQESKP